MGWRIRHGVDLGTGAVLVAGALMATVARLAYDLFAHHHSTHRPERG